MVVCGVPEAALMAAWKDKQHTQIEQPTTELLQEVIKTPREESVSEKEMRNHTEKLLADERLTNAKLLENL